MNLDNLLKSMVEQRGSDLHITVGVPPKARIHGDLQDLDAHPMSDEQVKECIKRCLTEDQVRTLVTKYDVDALYFNPTLGRFRVNAFRQLGSFAMVFRHIPTRIATLDELGLPQVLKKLALLHRGIVLVTGTTGSGKSTSLAAMIDHINSEQSANIITIEDPVEFLHPHRMSIISQRELSVHAHSFAAALRDALREDPNVILVGEMRDLDTVALAVTAAETGHLVLSTLHTASAGQSINRIVDVFPPGQQEQARQQLSNSLQAIISQRLLPAVAGGRVLALEVMVNTPAIANLIRDGKTEQLYTVMQVSHESGMVTLDAHLVQLVQTGVISKAVGLEYALDKKSFAASTKGIA